MINTESLYFTGIAGFPFLFIALGLLLEPSKERVHKAFGSLYLALAIIYILSWVNPVWRPPLFFDNFLVPAIVFVMSHSLFEISLYLFGDEAVRGSRRKIFVFGLAWVFILWTLPFLDHLFALSPISYSVEDGKPMGPFQSINSSGVYVWPAAMTILSFRAGHWHLRDIPRTPGAAWIFLGAFGGLMAVLLLIGFSMMLSASGPYRTGHILLQLMMLVWYLFYRARPGVFRKVRKDIELSHSRRMPLSSSEAEEIARRLDKVVADETIFSLQTLSLNELAGRIGFPVYKLSAYLNGNLGLSFPAWRNGERIEYVKNRLCENPEISILDAAMEAGYNSKAVFNNQFKRLVGMSPSEYRNSGRNKD